VRFAFFDESGTSAKETVTVVAAVLIHADSQWKPLARRLGELIQIYVPADKRDGFVIHAVDLFSGKALGESWPPRKSWQFLEDVLSVAAISRLDFLVSFCRKLDTAALETALSGSDFSFLKDNNRRTKMQHALVFADCLSHVDQFLGQYFCDEIGTAIAEDHHEMRKIVKQIPTFFNGGSLGAFYPPMRSLVGAINFAAKQDEPMLQLADAIAWTTKRALAGMNNVERFVAALGLTESIATLMDKPMGRVFPRASFTQLSETGAA